MHRTTKAVPRAAFALSAAAALAAAVRITATLHVAAVTDGPVTAALTAIASVLIAGALCLSAVSAVAGGGWRPRT